MKRSARMKNYCALEALARNAMSASLNGVRPPNTHPPPPPASRESAATRNLIRDIMPTGLAQIAHTSARIIAPRPSPSRRGSLAGRGGEGIDGAFQDKYFSPSRIFHAPPAPSARAPPPPLSPHPTPGMEGREREREREREWSIF